MFKGAERHLEADPTNQKAYQENMVKLKEMWSFVICVSLMACQGSLAENFGKLDQAFDLNGASYIALSDYQDFSEVDSTDLVKKYGEAYPIQRQDALAGPIPIFGLVVIGGLAAGAGAVFQAAEARNNLQTQANTIRTALGTAQTNFNTLTTQISALSSATITTASRASAACVAVSAAGGVFPAPAAGNDAAVNEAALASIIGAIGTSPCP